MRPGAGEVLHFSEDPGIGRFVPHVAKTAQVAGAYVWAVGGDRAPCYWFPRQCPRGTAWATEGTTAEDRVRVFGSGSVGRVHAVEYGWVEALRTTRLYAYRFSADDFRPHGDFFVATEPVVPLGPAQPVGDLLALHDEAGIELRVLANLWPFWDQVAASTLAFSGIRLANGRPR